MRAVAEEACLEGLEVDGEPFGVAEGPGAGVGEGAVWEGCCLEAVGVSHDDEFDVVVEQGLCAAGGEVVASELGFEGFVDCGDVGHGLCEGFESGAHEPTGGEVGGGLEGFDLFDFRVELVAVEDEDVSVGGWDESSFGDTELGALGVVVSEDGVVGFESLEGFAPLESYAFEVLFPGTGQGWAAEVVEVSGDDDGVVGGFEEVEPAIDLVFGDAAAVHLAWGEVQVGDDGDVHEGAIFLSQKVMAWVVSASCPTSFQSNVVWSSGNFL